MLVEPLLGPRGDMDAAPGNTNKIAPKTVAKSEKTNTRLLRTGK